MPKRTFDMGRAKIEFEALVDKATGPLKELIADLRDQILASDDASISSERLSQSLDKFVASSKHIDTKEIEQFKVSLKEVADNIDDIEVEDQ